MPFGILATLWVLARIVLASNLIVLLLADRIIAAAGPAALQIIGNVLSILLAGLVQLMISAGTDLGLIQKLQHST